MGANLVYLSYQDSLGKEKIKSQWAAAVESSLFESGHSYSGEIGMLGARIASWHDLNLADENLADQWLADNQEKWRSAKAVSFQVNDLKYWLIGGWASS